MANSNLHKARKSKNDEFYTQYEDIEKELEHYKDQLAGKVVYCNCDRMSQSNFWKYFVVNFEELGLKTAICSWFNKDGSSTAMVYNGKRNIIRYSLKGNGDFRSEECLRLLDMCDIVITNPPFSLFREFVALLNKYNKDFLIVGSNNAITYKEVFPLIKEDKIRIGYNEPHNFNTPNLLIKRVYTHWYTTLNVNTLFIELKETYYGNEEKYPKYGNLNAINVNKCKDIPSDYYGLIGVPIGILIKDRNGMFDVIGLFNGPSHAKELGAKRIEIISNGKVKSTFGPVINKKQLYVRIIIKRKRRVA